MRVFVAGATGTIGRQLEPGRIADAVARARPDVIVHQLTAIGALDMRHFDRPWRTRWAPGSPCTCRASPARPGP